MSSWILLLIHLIICLIISLVKISKVNKIEVLSYFIIAFLYPVGGYIIVLNFRFNSSGINALEEEENDEDKIILFTDHKNLDSKVLVSIEDSIVFSNTKDKRKSIIDALKRDTSAYIDRLKVALTDEDTETAHYAASAISEFKRNLDLKLQKFMFEYENNKGDFEISTDYYDVLEQYIKSELLDEQEKKQYSVLSIEVLENIVEKFEYDEKYIYDLINKLLDRQELSKAKSYSDIYYERFKTENSYISRLNYYFRTKDKKNFDLVFTELKNSPIKLGSKALSILRFWLKG